MRYAVVIEAAGDNYSAYVAADESELSTRGGQPATNERAMKKADADAMRAEYDFSGGVRGKYLPRLAKGANVVVLDRDMPRYFQPLRPSTTRSVF